MRTAKYRPGRRRSAGFHGRPRIIAAVATLLAFGGIVTVTQVSDASTRRATERASSSASPSPGTSSADIEAGEGGASRADSSASLRESSSAPAEPTRGPSDSQSGQTPNADSTAGASTAGAQVNGLDILTNSCDTSELPPHDGFQKGDRCVSTEFGEVGAAANNPSLLITRAPGSVVVNTPFSITVSTRNLIRDRFLAAGKGGYYVESSVLQDGLVRGHFHTACRMLTGTGAAPAPEPAPAFFVATEDSRGGREPDSVTINVPGLPSPGVAQCASWAGDGSHRIPMMERANQTPAFDAVRIRVRAR
jgi:hypothetical protein